MKNIELLTRRDLLSKGLKTAAILGLGMSTLGALGDKASIIDKAWANFDPRALQYDPEATCVLTCSQTLGPCYYSTGLIRSDITEGQSGLTTNLAFRIVDADTCLPIAGATVDLWHTNAGGLYSAPITAMCNGNDAAAQAARFCRGIQTSDANGYVRFKTIYPGWYSGRTVHMHAAVRIGNTAIVTTQFYFADKISDYVFRNYAPYTSRSERNTRNTNDNILGGSLTRMAPYILSTNTLRDRSLIGTKTIAIRTSPTACSA